MSLPHSRGRRLLLGALVTAAIVGLGPPPVSADYESLYVVGLRAVDQKRYIDGVIVFSKAIEQRPEPGGLVRPYGTWSESYVPHYYLGLCLYHLGRFADADEAWQTFEAHEVSSYPRNRSKRQRIAELRAGLAQAVARARDELVREIDLAKGNLGELDEVWLRQRSGEGGSAEVLASLDEALARLEGAQPAELAGVLRGLRPVVDDAWQKLEEGSRAKIAAERESKVAEELEERRRRRSEFETALEAMAVETCAREALAQLRELLHRPTLATPDLRPSVLAGRLAQGYLRCDEAELAGVYLALALADARRQGTEEELRELEGIERLALEGREAVPEDPETLVARARAWVELGECRPEVREWLDRAEGEGATGDFALLRARADRNCGNAEGVEQAIAVRTAQGLDEAWQDLEGWLAESSLSRLYGESHALMIVAHDYDLDKTGWNPLPGALEDLEAMRQALAAQGFSIEILRNPKSHELDGKIRSFVRRRGRDPDNRLLVYFAGHGWTEKEMGARNGYIIPVDAPHPDRGDEAFDYMVGLGIFELTARPIKARHSLFVFDSCFGGRPFAQARTRLEPLPPGGTDELLARPARLFLSAGEEDQPVPDFSVFRRTLVRGLSGEADQDQDQLVLGRELADFVRSEVEAMSYTTPQWGLLAEGDLASGDIAFESGLEMSGPRSMQLVIEDDFWDALTASPAGDVHDEYLALYPEGTYSALARARRGSEPD